MNRHALDMKPILVTWFFYVCTIANVVVMVRKKNKQTNKQTNMN